MKEYYSIDDVAVMTMLSTRTIRSYIKSGFLVEDKSNENWRFLPENIGQFLKNKNVKPSILAKRNGIVYGFISDNKKSEDKVCSIYDYLVENIIFIYKVMYVITVELIWNFIISTRSVSDL